MSGLEQGLLGFAAALALIALRVPVAFAMLLVGMLGAYLLEAPPTVDYLLGNLPFETVTPYGLSVVPLFVLMGAFASHAGLSRRLYGGLHALIGHQRGGLASATVAASAGFGAICGSSLATCATLGRVALPEMARHGYAPRLAAGSVAAGGTLGVLIPPSIILVLYGLLTRESIGALFAAALIPGVLAAVGYGLAIQVSTRLDPDLAPAAPARPWAQRLHALLAIWDVILLFAVVIGGIYAGWFSPTEAAAVGAFGAFVFALLNGEMNRQALLASLLETARTTGMIFMILIGAAVFNFYIELTELPQSLSLALQGSGLPGIGMLVLILVFYLVLGCFMDSLSMLLLTLPAMHPLAQAYGFDAIWFGVLIVSVIEIGLITPPVGMNLFILKGLDERLAMSTMARGIVPFLCADALRIALLVLFPALTLWLPGWLGLG